MAQKRHSHPIASQSKKPRRKIVHIGNDIIFFEILPKLPVKSILRFRAVNKSWYDITSEPCFISRQLEHSRKNPKLTIMTYYRERRALDLYMYDGKQDDNHYARFMFGKRLHNDIKYLEKFPHSNGLVLYNTARRLSVCNPSTRKSIKLPPGTPNKYYSPSPHRMRGGFGFVSLNTNQNICKVVQYFYRKYNYLDRTFSVGFEVFRVGIDSSWRAVAEDPPYPPLFGLPVCTSKAIYFEIDNGLYNHNFAGQLMFSFDIKNETYSVIPNPPPCFSECHSGVKVTFEHCYFAYNYSLHEIDDSVCLAVYDYYVKDKWDIWKYNEDSSTWIFYFGFQKSFAHFEFVRVQEGKILMHVFEESNEQQLVWYDPQTESFEPMVVLTEDISYLKRSNIVQCSDSKPVLFQVFSRAESLVPVTSMNYG